MTAEEAGEFFGPTTGLHANRGETSAVMAIDPDLVDLDAANAELPPFPEVTNQAPVHTAFFFSAPGSVHRATHSGTWGDAREATVEYGERYLEVVTEATVRVLDDIERTFAAMPPRYVVRLDPRSGAHDPPDREVVVELDDVGTLADGDPAAVGDAKQGQRDAGRGGDGSRERNAGRRRACGPRRRGRGRSRPGSSSRRG